MIVETGESPPLRSAADRTAPVASAPAGLSRVVGFDPTELASSTWLPDEPKALWASIAADGRPFNGAYVPLVIHDSMMAERAYDAAEWAADLIVSAGGHSLCIAPFVDRAAKLGAALTPRQWNHAAAMIERLEELCHRYRLRAVVKDVVGERPGRDDAGPDAVGPIHYVLDAGNFLSDGFVPAVLLSPVRFGRDGVEPVEPRTVAPDDRARPSEGHRP